MIYRLQIVLIPHFCVDFVELLHEVDVRAILIDQPGDLFLVEIVELIESKVGRHEPFPGCVHRNLSPYFKCCLHLHEKNVLLVFYELLCLQKLGGKSVLLDVAERDIFCYLLHCSIRLWPKRKTSILSW